METTTTETTPKAEKAITIETLPELVNDLRAAKAAGRAAIEGVEDGGTCNFDSPVLNCANKTEQRLVAAAAKIAGGDTFPWRLFRKVVGLVLSFDRPGQANRNTVYAEAFRKYLEAKGWPTSMYYQCD